MINVRYSIENLIEQSCRSGDKPKCTQVHEGSQTITISTEQNDN